MGQHSYSLGVKGTKVQLWLHSLPNQWCLERKESRLGGKGKFSKRSRKDQKYKKMDLDSKIRKNNIKTRREIIASPTGQKPNKQKNDNNKTTVSRVS